MRKKVFLVTYYWPPAGGPGVQRWLKFVKYLPEFGIDPIVVIPDNPNYPLRDEALEKEVDSSVSIVRIPIWEPYQLGAKLGFKQVNTLSSGIITPKDKRSWKENVLLKIRGNLFLPDARVAWIRPVVKQLSNLLAAEEKPIVITTGPPHSLHLIGLHLQKRIPTLHWIADFRDPWTTIGYHKELNLSKWATRRHLELEQNVLQSANQVIVTSPYTQRDFQSKTTQPVHWISNGFDDEIVPPVQRSKRFRLAHIGSLLSGRNPLVLWEALAELANEHAEFSSDLELQLVGRLSEDVVNSIRSVGLSDALRVESYVSHQQALIYQRQAQVLLLIEIDSDDTRAIIPGKLFEYFAAQRPILAIGPKGSDVPTLLEQTQTGAYFSSAEKEAIKKQICKHYLAYKANTLEVEASTLTAFSRKALTEKLVSILP